MPNIMFAMPIAFQRHESCGYDYNAGPSNSGWRQESIVRDGLFGSERDGESKMGFLYYVWAILMTGCCLVTMR